MYDELETRRWQNKNATPKLKLRLAAFLFEKRINSLEHREADGRRIADNQFPRGLQGWIKGVTGQIVHTGKEI